MSFFPLLHSALGSPSQKHFGCAKKLFPCRCSSLFNPVVFQCSLDSALAKSLSLSHFLQHTLLMPQSSWPSIPFIGRHRPLQRLIELCSQQETDNDGERRLIAVEGVKGVGLSRLLDEFTRQLQQQERTYLLRADYSQNLRRAPFAQLLDSLDHLLADHFPTRRLLALFSDPAHAALLPQLPATAERIGGDDDGSASNSVLTDTTALSAHLASLLVQMARLRPVVLVLEDAQWMPEPTQQALLGLHVALEDAPVLMIATLCSDHPESLKFRRRTEPLLLEQIMIAPWEHHELSALLTELFGPHIATRLGKELWRAAEGLPSQTIGLLRRLVASGSLTQNGAGEWQLGKIDRLLLVATGHDAATPDSQQLQQCPPAQRMMLGLLYCVAGGASVAEFCQWFDAVVASVAWEDSPKKSAETILAELRDIGMIRLPSLPSGIVLFLRPELEQQVEIELRDDELEQIARLVVFPEAEGLEIRRCIGASRFMRAVFRQLPNNQPELRRRVLDPLIGPQLLHEFDGDPAALHQIHTMLLQEPEMLTPVEYAMALSRMGLSLSFTRQYDKAIEFIRKMHDMATTIPDCAPLLAEACALLAGTLYFVDRTYNPMPLFAEATAALDRIADKQERQGVALFITKVEWNTIPVDQPQRTLQLTRRLYHLMLELGIPGKHEMLSAIVMSSARLRDGEVLHRYCNELLDEIHLRNMAVPFITLFNAARAAHTFGDLFLFRKLYSAWNGASAPIVMRDFMARNILNAMLAVDDGDTERAVQELQSARAEYCRHREYAEEIWWDLLFLHTMLVGQLARVLVLAGENETAAEFIDQAISESETDGVAAHYPDIIRMLTLYRFYLRWRSQYTAPQALLAWGKPPVIASVPQSKPVHVGYSAAAIEAAEAYRQRNRELSAVAPPPVMFVGEMLLATIEAAEGKFDAATEAINQAEEYARRIYNYQYDVEIQVSRITLALRRAASEGLSATARREVMETVRGVMQGLAERGLPEKIERLKEFLSDEAAATDAELAEQIQRAGNTSVSVAQGVLQNSRSATSGSVNAPRLFIMGPLRLMQPYSYMELSDSAFDRETARTLLTALAAAQIMGQTLTREELAGRIAPKAKTPEQQKKALYNAASAARAACCSAESILPVGSNSLGLNTNPEVPGYVWVDAIALLQLIASARQQERAGASSAAFNSYRDALTIARRGDFAPDCYDDWADPPRDLLRGRVRDAVLALGKLALRNGLYAPAIEAATVQISRDPYDEPMHRLLMRLHNDSGNRSAALKQFDKCAKLLKREFDAEPERETMKLRVEILKG